MSFGLSEKTVSSICAILGQHPEIDRAIIYGSRAKGNYRSGSDIDLTLVGADLSYDDLLQIMRELDESPIPYKVDLSILHYIEDAFVRDHIERRGQLFYQRAT